MAKNSKKADELTVGRPPLCREPWQNYYILRRGVLPCCYGHQAIAPMSGWQTGWNSPELQEIRSYLAKGALSPYCLLSVSCPIVQIYMRDHRGTSLPQQPPGRPPVQRFVNRLLGGLPGRIYRRMKGKARRA